MDASISPNEDLIPASHVSQSNSRYEVQQRQFDDTVQFAAPWTFFDVPREVRDIIYGFYFASTFIIVQIQSKAVMFRLDQKWKKKYVLGWFDPRNPAVPCDVWPLFMVSKSMFIEARRAFLYKSTFVFTKPEDFFDVLHGCHIPGLPLRFIDDVGFNPLTHVRRLWLNMAGSKEQFPRICRDLRSIIRIMHCRMQLDELFITFDESSRFFADKRAGTVLFHSWLLRGLCLFARLEIFKLAYVEPSGRQNPRRQRRIRAAPRLSKIIQRMPYDLKRRATIHPRSLDEEDMTWLEVNEHATQKQLNRYKKREKPDSKVISNLEANLTTLGSKIEQKRAMLQQ